MSTFTSVITVAVPVTDQERTTNLFEQLGGTRRLDVELQPGFRWIEVGIGDAPTTLAIVATGDALPTGIDTGIRLAAPDARAAHATLTGLGVEVGELLDWPSAPLMFEFRDFDGNVFYVTEAPSDAY